jgi:hemoglobin
MKARHDILDLDDIKELVDFFYEKVQQDPLLAPVFNERIGGRWAEHLEKMYRFWQTVLLEERTYFGAPFPPHATLPVAHEHFKQWMDLFIETVDILFVGAKAGEAKWRAGKMAELFEFKIGDYQGRQIKPLI